MTWPKSRPCASRGEDRRQCSGCAALVVAVQPTDFRQLDQQGEGRGGLRPKPFLVAPKRLARHHLGTCPSESKGGSSFENSYPTLRHQALVPAVPPLRAAFCTGGHVRDVLKGRAGYRAHPPTNAGIMRLSDRPVPNLDCVCPGLIVNNIKLPIVEAQETAETFLDGSAPRDSASCTRESRRRWVSPRGTRRFVIPNDLAHAALAT